MSIATDRAFPNDPEFDSAVRRTIDRSVSVGGELMRQQVVALLLRELAGQRDERIDALIEKVKQLPKV
jgi:hypothetical protein